MRVEDFHPEGGSKTGKNGTPDVPVKRPRGVLGKPLAIRTRTIRASFRVDVDVLVSEPPVADDDLVVGSLTQHMTKSIANHKNLMISGIRITDLREPVEDEEDEDPDLLEQGAEEFEDDDLDVDDVDEDEPWPDDED